MNCFDGVDLLDEATLSNFLRFLMQSFHCTYVCFWSYVPTPSNCLRFQDGMYCEEFNTQMPSSSSGSLAQRLFHEYKQNIFVINSESNHVPGYAFRNSVPYLEFQELELLRVASNDTQRQFYQEARIKTAIFMGFKVGEIELGLSNMPTINTKMGIQGMFHLQEDFHQQPNINTQPQISHHDHHLNPIQSDPQNSISPSSSSSLRSLDSPEYSSLLYITNINIPTTNTSATSQPQEKLISPNSMINNCPNSIQILQRPISTTLASIASPRQLQDMQDLARLRNPRFPSQESEEETMTRTILAVLTCSTTPPFHPLFPSVSSSSASALMVPKNSSAFKSYVSGLLGSSLDHRLGMKKSLFKRSIQFFRSLSVVRNRQTLPIPRPSSTQLHHMMSERKRREKLNESFHALRALLPPGTKKDKASLLNTTKEYLASLKAQIEELSRRNKQLESQLFPSSGNKKDSNNDETMIHDQLLSNSSSTEDQRLIDVRVRHVSESISGNESQIVDLKVILRATISAEDLVLRILDFLKRVDNVSLISMEANTTAMTLTQSTPPINRLILRLRISEGSEWDESAFQEAVRRVVADLAQ